MSAAASAATPPTAHVGAVVFLHGSGDNGPNFQRWIGAESFVKALVDKGVHTEFPSARPIPYTVAGGQMSSVWFNRLAMEPSSPEQTRTVEDSVAQIESLLDELVAAGIPSSRIAVGGFSMGGGIALQTALRSKHALAGVFAMSSYMCDDAAVYSQLRSTPRSGLNIWMAHGADDDFVLPEWGQATAKALKAFEGLEVSWRAYPRLHHELRSDELVDLNEWLAPLVLGEEMCLNKSESRARE